MLLRPNTQGQLRFIRTERCAAPAHRDVSAFVGASFGEFRNRGQRACCRPQTNCLYKEVKVSGQLRAAHSAHPARLC